MQQLYNIFKHGVNVKAFNVNNKTTQELKLTTEGKAKWKLIISGY